jgi:hypothetical protein
MNRNAHYCGSTFNILHMCVLSGANGLLLSEERVAADAPPLALDTAFARRGASDFADDGAAPRARDATGRGRLDAGRDRGREAGGGLVTSMGGALLFRVFIRDSEMRERN